MPIRGIALALLDDNRFLKTSTQAIARSTGFKDELLRNFLIFLAPFNIKDELARNFLDFLMPFSIASTQRIDTCFRGGLPRNHLGLRCR
jgi:hypothetical protein